MRKFLVIGSTVALVVIMALLYLSSVATADYGIHDDAGLISTTDMCGSCHRVHTAQGVKLSMNTAATRQAFCLSCHDASASGSYLNVEDGVLDTGAPAALGTVGDGLRGGGFSAAKMDHDVDGVIGEVTTITSTHSIDETSLTAWGGSGGGSLGNSVSLTCASCHNPHGNGNYRILRETPNGMYVGAELYGTAQTATNAITTGANSIDGDFDDDTASADVGTLNDVWTFTAVEDPPSWVTAANAVEVRFYGTALVGGVIDLQVDDGAGWITVKTYDSVTQLPGTIATETIALTTELNSLTKVTAAQIQFITTTAQAGVTLNIDGVRLTTAATESDASVIALTDEVGNYTITYHGASETYPQYFRDVSYAPTSAEDWCAQCHTRYLASSSSGSTAAGTNYFNYRHTTDGLAGGCFRCHVAHGSSATMGANSQAVTWPDGTASGTDSKLLHVDSRGVCMACHDSGGTAADITAD